MGRLLLIARLGARDLRAALEAVLLLLAITVAATTLTLGLVLPRRHSPAGHRRAGGGSRSFPPSRAPWPAYREALRSSP